jgi:drug/metabolite transporter (DMT)-like permease
MLAILYLSVFGSVVAFVCYLYLLKEVSAVAVCSLVLVEPVIALAVDHLWEHGVRLVPVTYVGIVTTSVGLFMSLLRKAGETQTN